MKYIIGTRGSKLALVQSAYVRDRLRKAYPEHEFELKVIKTKGDLIQDKPLNQIGDKGVFVKEIEEQILWGQVQLGVHSMKDMPAVPAPGLMFTKSWKREDARDVLILREAKSLSELPAGAVIGTGSMRRRVQLLKLRPDLKVVDIRGNVDTRLRKMEEQKLDGLVLAAAGLKRLGMEGLITQYLEPWEMIPAPAQGILALEIREDDGELLKMLDALYDEDAWQAACVEREFLHLIGGDCHVPIGAYLSRLPDGSHRLRCIFGNESGSRTAVAQAEGALADALAKEAVRRIREQMAGTVYLVGAGPGDPGLITVKGLEAIRQADCIIYDRLSSPRLLEEAKVGCEFIYVGKENRNHTMKQEEINQLLAEKALLYKRVVRLKGGDVYVFGRGGEEGLYLKNHHIPFEVIPGISSSTAGPAYAGIPVTHRGAATGFHVVTAHDRTGELADLDFKAMASGKDTCVFLMGLSKLKEIAEGLMEAGMPPDTSAAVISKATTVLQRTITSDLAHIAEAVKEAGLSSPALIVAGEVVKLREKLNFFEEKPLFGKNYLVPKIGREASKLTMGLEQAGAFVTELIVGEIRQIERRFIRKELARIDWLVFTSKNGVDGFFQNLFASGLDLRAVGGTQVAAVGKQTAEYLERYGIRADLVPAVSNSDGLSKALKELVKPGDEVWHPKAANAEDGMKAYFSQLCQFKELEVYENCAVEIEPITKSMLDTIDGVFLTCASSALRFMEAAEQGAYHVLNEKGCVYSIGPKTSEALRKCGIIKVLEASWPSCDALMELVL